MRQMTRLLLILTAAVLLTMAYALGMMTGYAIGYNDNYARTVVEYRRGR